MSSKKPIVVVKKEPGSRPEPEDNGGATRSGGSGLCPCLRICASAPATQCPRPATRASRRVCRARVPRSSQHPDELHAAGLLLQCHSHPTPRTGWIPCRRTTRRTPSRRRCSTGPLPEVRRTASAPTKALNAFAASLGVSGARALGECLHQSLAPQRVSGVARRQRRQSARRVPALMLSVAYVSASTRERF
jgi:hypothetical protein